MTWEEISVPKDMSLLEITKDFEAQSASAHIDGHQRTVVVQGSMVYGFAVSHMIVKKGDVAKIMR